MCLGLSVGSSRRVDHGVRTSKARGGKQSKTLTGTLAAMLTVWAVDIQAIQVSLVSGAGGVWECLFR